MTARMLGQHVWWPALAAVLICLAPRGVHAQAPLVYQSQFAPPPGELAPPRMILVPTAAEAARRRAEIEREIVRLAVQRQPLTPPLITLGAGGVLTVAGLWGLESTGALPLPLPHDSGGQGPDSPAERRTNRLSGVALGTGLVLLGTGLIWLRVRVVQRRPFNDRIRELKHEVRELKLRSLGLAPQANGVQLQADFRF